MWVGHIFHGENWIHEIKLIKSRKIKRFGDSPTGIVDINIADGTPIIESLYCDEFTKADYKELKTFITQTLLFPNYEYSRYDCDLTRKKIKK